jgi:glycosyl hydrolase family 113
VRRLAVPLLAVVMTVAACGHPLIPPSALKPAKTAASPALSDLPVVGANPGGPVLGVPPDTPVLGVDLYAPSNYPAAVVAADGQRMLSYIKNVLKADAVGIVWDFFATSRHSDAVKATRATLSASNVGILTRIARQDHLQVEYRPLIFVPSKADPWEGLISPRHPAKWFSSYYRAELPYLRMAQKLGISEFVAATEMKDLNSSPLWPSFFRRVSQVYRGVVSYTAWDKDYVGNPLLPVKYLGMDMYHPLGLSATATSAQVTAVWESYFSGVPASVLRRTAIDETGIAARVRAYRHPADLGAPGRLDERVQANWYTAACATVRRYRMRGVFFWKVDLADYPAHPATSLSTFEGRKGAVAISECARILR